MLPQPELHLVPVPLHPAAAGLQLPFVSHLQRQRGSNFTIGFRVSGTLPRRAGTDSSSVAPAPAAAGSAGASSRPRGSGRRSLQQFEFAPVETPYGQFKVSVAYQPASRVTILEQTASPPPLPQIISDYVGGGRAPGQLPLRHTMSASLCSEQQGVQGQRALRGGAASAASTAHAGPQGAPASPSGQMQRQSSAFTPLPRHSWSSSAMRISPNRLCSPHHPQQHPGAQLSPFANREGPGGTPYGSAPQLVGSRAWLGGPDVAEDCWQPTEVLANS